MIPPRLSRVTISCSTSNVLLNVSGQRPGYTGEDEETAAHSDEVEAMDAALIATVFDPPPIRAVQAAQASGAIRGGRARARAGAGEQGLSSLVRPHLLSIFISFAPTVHSPPRSLPSRCSLISAQRSTKSSCRCCCLARLRSLPGGIDKMQTFFPANRLGWWCSMCCNR